MTAVRDNGVRFGLPVASLAEAAGLLPIDAVDLLVDNEVRGHPRYGWRTLAAMRGLLGRLEVGRCVGGRGATPLRDGSPIIAV